MVTGSVQLPTRLQVKTHSAMMCGVRHSCTNPCMHKRAVMAECARTTLQGKAPKQGSVPAAVQRAEKAAQVEGHCVEAERRLVEQRAQRGWHPGLGVQAKQAPNLATGAATRQGNRDPPACSRTRSSCAST